VKFQFIEEHRSEFRVEKMCRLFQVSRSGYYKARKACKSQRVKRQEELAVQIETLFDDHKGTYGAPRITDCLRDAKVVVGEKTVGRLMRKLGLQACGRKKFRVATTDSNHGLPVSPNLLEQKFHTTAPNKVWMVDITYIGTREGKMYLASVMDLYTRKIVGWSLDSHMKTDLVLEALDKAVAAQKPPKGLIHHSDRGAQYAALEYQERLKAYNMVGSMSRKGNCYDNACIESYHGTLKRELIYRQRLTTRQMARELIYEYLEFFYNRKRKHSSLGYLSPDRFETKFYKELKRSTHNILAVSTLLT
jgi:transposase InsO family protein